MCTCVAGDESLIEDEVRQKAASPPGRVPHLTLRLYASVRVVSLSAALYVCGRTGRCSLDASTRRKRAGRPEYRSPEGDIVFGPDPAGS